MTKSKRRARGMTMLEVVMSIALLVLVTTLLFVTTSRASQMFVTVHNADEEYYKFYNTRQELVTLAKSAREVVPSPNGGWMFYGTDSSTTRVQLQNGAVVINGETISPASDLRIGQNGDRIDILVESEEYPAIQASVYMEWKLW